MAKKTLSLTLSLLCSGASVLAADPTLASVSVTSTDTTQAGDEGSVNASSSSDSQQAVLPAAVPSSSESSDTTTIVGRFDASGAPTTAVTIASTPSQPSDVPSSNTLSEVLSVIAVDPLPFSWTNPKTWNVNDTLSRLNPMLSEQERAEKVAEKALKAEVVQAEKQLAGVWRTAHESLPSLEETADDVALKLAAWEKISTGLAHTLVTGLIAAQGEPAYIKGAMQAELSKIADAEQRAQVVVKMASLLEEMKLKAVADFNTLSSSRGFFRSADSMAESNAALGSMKELTDTYDNLKAKIEAEADCLVHGAKAGNSITRNPVASALVATAVVVTGVSVGCALVLLGQRDAAVQELQEAGVNQAAAVLATTRNGVTWACQVAAQALRGGVEKAEPSADGVEGLLRAAGVNLAGGVLNDQGVPVFPTK